ncbi:MAG: hypothetical protein D5R98_07960 [Desulfonatronovibrio sp. MSAO_Bac4]|nr:MAG: hypothetical protein D5R98_07960 [Desulfonatronovibrio sp. MSAO_Bac4]
MIRLLTTSFLFCLAMVFSFGFNLDAEIQEEGERIILQRCLMCHDSKRIEDAEYDHKGWKETVERMMSIGSRITPAEKEILIDYLTRDLEETDSED